MSSASEFVQAEIKAHPVVVFSKSYCPYCSRAKSALASTGVHGKDIAVHELDKMPDGSAIQSALSFTGATSVPRVFVGGKFIGGGDDTAALAASGKLKDLVKAAGAAV
jgi:glutaredoxin 3